MDNTIYIHLSECTEITRCVIGDCTRDATYNVTVPPFTPALQRLGVLEVSVCADHLPPGANHHA